MYADKTLLDTEKFETKKQTLLNLLVANKLNFKFEFIKIFLTESPLEPFYISIDFFLHRYKLNSPKYSIFSTFYLKLWPTPRSKVCMFFFVLSIH